MMYRMPPSDEGGVFCVAKDGGRESNVPFAVLCSRQTLRITIFLSAPLVGATIGRPRASAPISCGTENPSPTISTPTSHCRDKKPPLCKGRGTTIVVEGLYRQHTIMRFVEDAKPYDKNILTVITATTAATKSATNAEKSVWRIFFILTAP